MSLEDTNLYAEILRSKYGPRAARIMEKVEGDIDDSFLGFTGSYKLLAQLIPKGRTVIDLGCAYGFQSWYFQGHKQYVGVDVGNLFFRIKGSKFYSLNIHDFILKHAEEYKHCFAICNYVPVRTDELRKAFEHLFVFYPERGDNPEQAEWENKYPF